MPALTWMSQHRWWALGVGATTLLVLVVAGVWFFVFRSPATRVDLRQALRLYRLEEKAEPGATDRLLPSDGVYQYRTSGGEQLSVGGISRSFPATSDMIVTGDRCATMEWEPFEQHMEGLVECRQNDGALSIGSALSYEEIAGTRTTSVIDCPADTYFVPPHWFAGERWRSTCRSGDEKVEFAGQVIGSSTVDVGRKEVPALHTRLTLTFSGSEFGTNPNDYWIGWDGLILRQRESVNVAQNAGPLGSVRYTEEMAITLTSMTPSR
jgi:hypothetical protein